MRFCYLRIALLTSAFAANAFAETAETDVKLAAPRTTSSPTSVRDDSASSALTETHEPTSVDDENRGKLTVRNFAGIIGRTYEIKGGIRVGYFDKLLAEKRITKALYHDLGLNYPKGDVLFDMNWVRWAFFVCQLGHHFRENEYKFLITAMSAIYDAETLSDILVAAATEEKTEFLAINLTKFADDHIKSRVLDKFPSLTKMLFHRKQHTTSTIQTPTRERVNAYIKSYATDKTLQDKEFSILTSYLSVLLSKDYAVSPGRPVSHECSEDAALLQTLLSLENFHDPQCLGDLVSIWVDVSVPPSKVVSMLVQDKAEADHFSILFTNGPSKNFWLNYLEKYNALSRKHNLPDSANANFHKLLQMLFTVVKQESPAIDKAMAYTTLLKLLLSPSSTHLSSSHEFVMKLMSILLKNRTLPSDVLAMLMHGVADADKYTAIFLNKSSKRFWVRYLEKFNAISRNYILTDSANANFHELLQMLFTVVEQESPAIDKSMAYTTLLKLLLLPSSSHLSSSHEFVMKLMSILLSKKILPSDVLSMLMHGKADTDKYTIFFVNKPSKSFWMRYLKMYNEASVNDEDSTRIANSDFQRLLVMLHDVKKPESSTDSKFLATSTILKMLIAPENANIIRAQQYKEALRANWLEKRFRPDAVVSLLLLEEKEADYFKILFTDTPSSKYWEDYTNAFYAANPTLGNYKLATLIDVFDVAKLKSILEAALTDETTRNKAESLLALLKWWTNGLNGDW